jgi:hypothetical protein
VMMMMISLLIYNIVTIFTTKMVVVNIGTTVLT